MSLQIFLLHQIKISKSFQQILKQEKFKEDVESYQSHAVAVEEFVGNEELMEQLNRKIEKILHETIRLSSHVKVSVEEVKASLLNVEASVKNLISNLKQWSKNLDSKDYYLNYQYMKNIYHAASQLLTSCDSNNGFESYPSCILNIDRSVSKHGWIYDDIENLNKFLIEDAIVSDELQLTIVRMFNQACEQIRAKYNSSNQTMMLFASKEENGKQSTFNSLDQQSGRSHRHSFITSRKQ